MYLFLKNIAKSVFPKQWLYKHEPAFRKAFAIGYGGKNFHCNVCQSGLSKFIELPTGDLLCPFCGSLPRNRRLWQLLNEKDLLKGRILDFSPSRCLHREMVKRRDIEYVSTDFAGEFEAQKSYDIIRIEEPHSSFDLIICFHVLEHVEADSTAMAELYRVLKKNGKAIIQTPFKDGDIFEDVTIRTPKERLKYFGQEDHVRVYSVQGLKKRLEQAGFEVQVLSFTLDEQMKGNESGMKERESILVATK